MSSFGVGESRPLVFLDTSGARVHSNRGIGRYIDGLCAGFEAIGALGTIVTIDPADREFTPLVHLPLLRNPRDDKPPRGQRTIGTIYDFTPLRFPLTVFRPWQIRAAKNLISQMRSARACDHLVAISTATASDASRFLRRGRDGVTTIFPGVARNFAQSSSVKEDQQDFRSLLYVGAASRHKNIHRLIHSHAIIADPQCKLILAGLITQRQRARIEQLTRRLGSSGRVSVLGPVTDADLVTLYLNSTALILPSLWEGFGLPALEAMAAGTPVICSRTSSLPEVVGTCGKLIDPRDISDMARTIDLVLGDPHLRNSLRECGMRRAESFSWEAAASQHVALYRQLAARQ